MLKKKCKKTTRKNKYSEHKIELGSKFNEQKLLNFTTQQ